MANGNDYIYMETQNIPVTVGVIVYNSSKYVLETLESIKAQTYQPLKLIIGDDCSTDNTVELCRKWIEENKSRFISTRIIVPEHNTGVSGNCNRVEDACDTEWYKGVAGDDILMPDCIENNIVYIKTHPDTVMVFSKVKSFGASEDKCNRIDNEVFKYDFFNWTPEEQYRFLYEERNCIPAPTLFQNIIKTREFGLKNDERIPLLEDYPKWLNALKLGIAFSFIDKETVSYRLDPASLSTSGRPSKRFMISCQLFDVYYHHSDLFQDDPKALVDFLVERNVSTKLSLQNDLEVALNSRTYRVGHFILSPVIWVRKLIAKQKV